jgi:hypothetical protein
MIASLQEHRSRLQRKLKMVAHSVIQINRWSFICGFAGTMFERDSEIVFPLTVTRRPGVVRDHRRTALRECSAGDAHEENYNR